MISFIRRHQSWLIALSIVGVLSAWMASGATGPGEAHARTAPEPAPERVEPAFKVRTTLSRESAVTREVIIRGRTEPARAATLRAELDGRVVEVLAERGTRISVGDVIVRLDLRDREARLAEARARVRQFEIEFAALTELSKRNYQSRTGLAEAAAGLEAARAAVRHAEVEIANTRIVAPFTGTLERRPVEIGDFVSSGDEVARLIEPDPIVVTGHVTQRDLARIAVGAPGTAELVTGERIEGRVRYVASESDAATRTFTVELEAPNPGGAIAAGITAELRVPTGAVRAHRLSPALLSLDADDAIGVKTVGAGDIVEFHPVDIVQAGIDGVWVAGLPAEIRIITVGHGFVHTGDRVEPVAAAPGKVGDGS